MYSNTIENFNKMFAGIPILKKVFYFIPLRNGNIVLGLAGAIYYLVQFICLIIKYSLDPFSAQDKIIYGIVIVVSLIHAIGCSMFVVGIVYKNYFLIFPWLCSHTLMTADIIIFYMIEMPSPEVISFLFNYFLFQAYIWLCGYSIFERVRTRGTAYSAVAMPTNLVDKYKEEFSTVQISDTNLPASRAKSKCNTVEIKIHERLK